jgi:hypothetical protein
VPAVLRHDQRLHRASSWSASSSSSPCRSDRGPGPQQPSRDTAAPPVADRRAPGHWRTASACVAPRPGSPAADPGQGQVLHQPVLRHQAHLSSGVRLPP